MKESAAVRLAPPTPPGSRPDDLFGRVVEAVRSWAGADRPLRRNLPGEGRLQLDRGLPFLVLFRETPGVADAGTDTLITALAAYVLASGDPAHADGLRDVIAAVAGDARSRFGAFLLVELWSERGDREPAGAPALIRIHVPAGAGETAETLRSALVEMRLTAENGGELGAPAALDRVEIAEDAAVAPPGLDPVALDPEIVHLGVEVAPFFRDSATGAEHPRVLQALRRELSRAIERAVFGFSQERTSLDSPHFRALGRRHVGRAARHVDHRLAEVYGAFDPLLQVTPVNTEEAWRGFRQGRFERPPALRYRPLPFDPEHLKRRLFHVPIEKVEDPLLNYLFREKQEELDREITLVRNLCTPRFQWSSYQLHGVVEDDLLRLARTILDRLPVEDEEEYGEASSPAPGFVDAQAFARAAHEELDHYRRLSPSFTGGVEIRSDVTAGLMVSKGVLCVAEGLNVPRHRLAPLLHHEVGTHVVTYSNGLSQPFKIFASGLAGYDALQEGLAVLSEYLVGGLTRARARVLAGRVVGVHALVDGADFVETFRCLGRDLGFPDRTAFIMTVRIHRGGGLTKDAQYLRGLRELLAYLRSEGSIEPLFVGKVGLAHIPVVQELVLRGVLELPPIKPRWLMDLGAMERLGACRRQDVMDLIETIGRQEPR